jgi:competence protein ComEA
MKSIYLVIFGILFGLLAAGVILLINGPGRGAPLELPPAPTQAPIIVDVSGAVANPGVYQMPVGSRVEDAIKEAGGLLPDAYAETLNMAAPLSDGSKVLVPILNEQSTSPVDGQTSTGSSAYPSLQVNINTATLESLMTLPGIGEVKAQAIIDYRTEHGPFSAPEEIQNVHGIGPATYENLKDLITIY